MTQRYIETDNIAAVNAARWLRFVLKVPTHTSIIPEFELEFNCQIFYEDPYLIGKIYFNSKQDLSWFLLKWT